MKKILVLGASSFLGSNLCVALRKRYLLYGTRASRPVRVDGVPILKLTIAPESAAVVQETVNRIRPDIVIYCPAIRAESRCKADPMEALFVNAEAAAVAASAIQRWEGRFIYLSTSKVFNGERGKYREDDDPKPNSIYGKSKLKGEELLQHFPNVFVLRLGTVFGIGALGQDSMLGRLLESLWSGETKALIDDEARSFIAAEDVCRFVEACVEAPADKAGLYHIGSASPETYYSFGTTVAAAFQLSAEGLQAVSGQTFEGGGFEAATRGRHLTLDGKLFKETFGLAPKTLEFSLKLIQNKLRKGIQ